MGRQARHRFDMIWRVSRRTSRIARSFCPSRLWNFFHLVWLSPWYAISCTPSRKWLLRIGSSLSVWSWERIRLWKVIIHLLISPFASSVHPYGRLLLISTVFRAPLALLCRFCRQNAVCIAHNAHQTSRCIIRSHRDGFARLFSFEGQFLRHLIWIFFWSILDHFIFSVIHSHS